MESALLALVREAVMLTLLVSAPPLLAALGVGVVTGVLQAATQVQEQSVAVVPRLAAVLVALAASGPWIAARLVRFATGCLELLPRVAP
ncbi:MAG TPA: flagellar biosynthetic protein FliQ [Anaeromyxobacteraceae bacterium]